MVVYTHPIIINNGFISFYENTQSFPGNSLAAIGIWYKILSHDLISDQKLNSKHE